MSIQPIQESVKGVIQYYTQNPDKALSEDKPATARLEEGLRCRAISRAVPLKVSVEAV